jgi:endonuclease/exonuclease/phosphatase family metal-dependent hydrolase
MKLSVLTWNIEFFDKTISRIQHVAASILSTQADVVALQEVSKEAWVLLSPLLEHIYPYSTGLQGFEAREDEVLQLCNVIISQRVIEKTYAVSFETKQLSCRGYVVAQIAGCCVACTHLDSSVDRGSIRQAQIAQICQDVNIDLLVGDMNCTPEYPEYKEFVFAGWNDLWNESMFGPGFTEDTETNPKRVEIMRNRGYTELTRQVRFDQMWTKPQAGIIALDICVIKHPMFDALIGFTYASDHYAVLASILSV